jgi:hypothetical protein
MKAGWDKKYARGSNGGYLVDENGEHMWCMYDMVDYYFNVILTRHWLKKGENNNGSNK